MRLGRGRSEASQPVELPERAATVLLVLASGEKLPARVVERAENALLVAITVPTGPLSNSQLDGLVLEFTNAHGRVRLSGTVTVEDPNEHDLLRIEHPRSIEVLQQREYVRIQAARPVVMYDSRDHLQIQSFTVDVSGGGLLLAGPETLKIGEVIEFQVTITPGVLPIKGTGRVVRTDARGRRAVSFESISDFDRRRLVRFIFECQRAERQRGLQQEERHGD
jgi:hypothetical protein